ncbi:MAG TPA: hypothetical protein VHV54_21240, partial [Candidatus Binatia bacterium]|nr:hypothetical protein [Candidatus Binatia bacterium]
EAQQKRVGWPLSPILGQTVADKVAMRQLRICLRIELEILPVTGFGKASQSYLNFWDVRRNWGSGLES